MLGICPSLVTPKEKNAAGRLGSQLFRVDSLAASGHSDALFPGMQMKVPVFGPKTSDRSTLPES